MQVCFLTPSGNQLRTMHTAPVKGMFVRGLADIDGDFCEITGVLYDLSSDLIYCEVESIHADLDRRAPGFVGSWGEL
jgi:hypothetical protein